MTRGEKELERKREGPDAGRPDTQHLSKTSTPSLLTLPHFPSFFSRPARRRANLFNRCIRELESKLRAAKLWPPRLRADGAALEEPPPAVERKAGEEAREGNGREGKS